VPILAISVTTIECDGHGGTLCPDNNAAEYPHPQSVAIRLAKQSGWTIWLETMCPECSKVTAAETVQAPSAPVMHTVDAAVPAPMVLLADAGEDASGWAATDRRRALVSA
jgi:hypothetical protein